MWHKPRLMTAVADLLLLAGGIALLVAAVIWGAPRLRLFPLNEVQVTQELREVRHSDVQEALSALLHGNFFTVSPEAVRLSLEQLPWVRRAEVWRKWPARIEVRIEEQQAAAHWGDGQGELVNTFGEVFSAPLTRAAVALAQRPDRVGRRGSASLRGVCAVVEASGCPAGARGLVAAAGVAVEDGEWNAG